MRKVTSILVIVDPTAKEHPCVDKAAILAKKFNAKVDLFCCETKATKAVRIATESTAENSSQREPIQLLQALAAPLRSAGLQVDTTTDCTEPLHAAVLAHVKKTDANFVIKDTHHHSLAQRTFLTNTDWQLIRGCSVPLLLTKAKRWRPDPAILVAVDPGHVNDKPALLDDRLLCWGETIAAQLMGEVHVAHTYLPMAMSTMALSGQPPVWISTSSELIKDERAVKLAELRSLIDGRAVAPENIHLEIGPPVDRLLMIAAQISADIVIAGAISRSGLQRIFVGSTAEQLLERVPCDILVIKPLNFSEGLPF